MDDDQRVPERNERGFAAGEEALFAATISACRREPGAVFAERKKRAVDDDQRVVARS